MTKLRALAKDAAEWEQSSKNRAGSLPRDGEVLKSLSLWRDAGEDHVGPDFPVESLAS